MRPKIYGNKNDLLKKHKVRFGHDRASVSVRFNPNYRALADAMFEVMAQLTYKTPHYSVDVVNSVMRFKNLESCRCLKNNARY